MDNTTIPDVRDSVTAIRLQQLSPYRNVRAIFAQFIAECESTDNITLRAMLPVFRSVDEQKALYAQGRSAPGKIVTNAQGGQSYHNYGLAVDLCELSADGTEVLWNFNMGTLDPIAKKYGLEWGGDWQSIKDRPHFQISFGFTWQQLLQMEKDADGYVIL